MRSDTNTDTPGAPGPVSRVARWWHGIPKDAKKMLAVGSGLVAFGTVYGGIGLHNAVDSTTNQHKFAHGTHVQARVEASQRAKGLFVSITLGYDADGSHYVSEVKDPNAVQADLSTGETVDAVYLPGSPKDVIIAGQYGDGFDQWSVFSTVLGGAIAVVGVGSVVGAFRRKGDSGPPRQDGTPSGLPPVRESPPEAWR